VENIEKCERKLIKDWNDLVGLENEKYILEINTNIGYGWIRDKSDYSCVAYLGTHTFYGSKHQFLTKLLNSYGFNVEIDNWDKGGTNG
jgi:uncharacterized protein YmfQ (DUF2313 family)